VPAGATIYMVVSSAMRIGTQEVMFRSGMVAPVAVEREIGSGKQEKEQEKEREKPPPPKPARPVQRKSTATDGTALAKGTVPPKPGAGTNGRNTANGRKPSNGKGRSGTRSGQGGQSQTPPPKAQNRSRSKRTRRAR
jgi:hypothetical protein